MSKRTIEYQAVREQVNAQTGEVIQMEISTDTKMIHKQEPAFVKLYIADVLYMRDMSRHLTNIVYALLEQATYTSKGLRVYVPTGLKNEIIKQLDIPRQSFNNALVKLCKGNILRRIDTGVYELNPYFFGRGEWKDIDNLRMTWEYSAIKGKTFQGAIVRKDGTMEQTGDAVNGQGQE